MSGPFSESLIPGSANGRLAGFEPVRVGSTPTPGTDRYPGGPAWSGRHSLKVKIVGSNPIQGTDGKVGNRQTTAV